jgi:hypothetical protein
MKYGQQQELPANEEYFEVFNKNKRIMYGITSSRDKHKIEEKYPEKYVFKKFDYIDLEKLDDRSKIFLNITSFEKLMIILIILLIMTVILV